MHYSYLEPGLHAELAAITPDEAVAHLRNHLGNLLLDPAVTAAYINRLGVLTPEETTPSSRAWLTYLLVRYCDLLPLDLAAQRILAQVTGNAAPHLRDLERCAIPDPIERKLERLGAGEDSERNRAMLLALLHEYPYSPAIMERLMAVELALDIPVGGEWLPSVRPPAGLMRPLHERLFIHAMMQGDTERALQHAAACVPDNPSPHLLNHLAELHARLGDAQQALNLYGASLEADPLQHPVKLRMEALAKPPRAHADALHHRIAICLYSFNKAELLERTLSSLAASQTGEAHILVLLNGCTDDSATRVAAVNERLFNGRLEVIDMPINIGAPAARNWLLAKQIVREADFVAFLDDDVDVPAAWLPRLVGNLEEHPGAGVAGTRVRNPGDVPRLQYLYRNISVARPGLIRLSLDTPTLHHDTGFYDFTRSTTSVMGCCHVFTRRALDEVPAFDLRFSPSQMDDIAHDIDLALAGFDVLYTGDVVCVHHQMSGLGRAHATDWKRFGNVAGNDVKFYYRFADRLDALGRLNNLGFMPDMPPA